MQYNTRGICMFKAATETPEQDSENVLSPKSKIQYSKSYIQQLTVSDLNR